MEVKECTLNDIPLACASSARESQFLKTCLSACVVQRASWRQRSAGGS